jgi:hypothetical protein
MMVGELWKKIDLLKIGKELGVPALGMVGLMFIGYALAVLYINNEKDIAQNQREAEGVRAQAAIEQSAKESENRQALLRQLIDAQIETSKMTASTLVRMGDNVAAMQKISAQSVENDKKVMSNQERIIEAIGQLCDKQGVTPKKPGGT